MCGLYGSINTNKPSFSLLDGLLKHRGPDGANEYSYKNVYLFHSRLAIQDLSKRAYQPFNFKHLSIIFNGEIYNHLELRERCKSFNFKTSSDTETLIALYLKYNFNMLNYLDGMFSIALLDRKNNSIFLARDRAGVKPLFIYEKNNMISFASELNTLSHISNPSINQSSVYKYLALGVINGSSIYENVREFPAGHYCEIDLNTLDYNLKQWWNVHDFYNQQSYLSIKDTSKKVEEYLYEGVKRRLQASDLEVGCFLSSGIDSCLVASLASKIKSGLKTFTVKFEGKYDESPTANKVASAIGTDHKVIEIDYKDLLKDIDQIIYNYGQPFADSSSIPSYYVSKEAKKYLTVILNGDGADEIFGGYRRYVLANSPFNVYGDNHLIKSILNPLLRALPHPKTKISMFNYLKRFGKVLKYSGFDSYLSLTVSAFDFNSFKSKPHVYLDKEIKLFNKILSNTNSNLEKTMQLDFELLFPGLLYKMDIATMSNSLEARSPFLTKELLEFAPTMKNKFRINGVNTKYILRRLAKEIVPYDIHNLPKKGFEPPLSNWVCGEMKDLIIDKIENNRLVSDFITEDEVKRLIEGFSNQNFDISWLRKVWRVFILEQWYSIITKRKINPLNK